MAEANGSSAIFDLMSALKGTLRTYNRAGRAIVPEQENRVLRLVGGHLMVVGVFNTAVSYHAFINIRLAITNYILVIHLVIQCFTFIAGIILMATGWFLVVGDNPRQYGCLVKTILFLAFIASAFTIGILL